MNMEKRKSAVSFSEPEYPACPLVSPSAQCSLLSLAIPHYSLPKYVSILNNHSKYTDRTGM
jgi:hypothetical protein